MPICNNFWSWSLKFQILYSLYVHIWTWCLKFFSLVFLAVVGFCWSLESEGAAYLWNITKMKTDFMLVDFLSTFCLILERSLFLEKRNKILCFIFVLFCKCIHHFSVINHFQVHNNIIILILNVKMCVMALYHHSDKNESILYHFLFNFVIFY